jgi:hypothetical protein
MCFCSNPITTKIQNKLSQNEKDVYLTITGFDSTSFLVLLDKPIFRQVDSLLLDSAIGKNIVSDYTNTNLNFTSWENYDFDLGIKYTIITSSTLNSIFSSDTNGWMAFDSKYPTANGYWKLSKIGFNIDSTKAIVYFTHQYANLGGTSCLLSLTKLNNMWSTYKVYYRVES